MLEVRCPRCTHTMRYEPRQGPIAHKTKRCVYCGSVFRVHTPEGTDRIVRIVPRGS